MLICGALAFAVNSFVVLVSAFAEDTPKAIEPNNNDNVRNFFIVFTPL
jgi:hypothetical protein